MILPPFSSKPASSWDKGAPLAATNDPSYNVSVAISARMLWRSTAAARGPMHDILPRLPSSPFIPCPSLIIFSLSCDRAFQTQRRSVSRGPRNCGEGPQNTCICTSLSSAFSLFRFSSTVLHRGHPKLRSLASATTVTHLLRKVSRSAPLPRFFRFFPLVNFR